MARKQFGSGLARLTNLTTARESITRAAEAGSAKRTTVQALKAEARDPGAWWPRV
jgi:hypothetical protein